MNDETVSSLTSSAYALDTMNLSAEEKELVLSVYMKGLHYIFIFFAACIGSAFVMTLGVGNTNLKKPFTQDNRKQTRQALESTVQLQSDRH